MAGRIKSLIDSGSERAQYTRAGINQARDEFSFHVTERVKTNYNHDRPIMIWQFLVRLSMASVFIGLAGFGLQIATGFARFNWTVGGVYIAAIAVGILTFGPTRRALERKRYEKDIGDVEYPTHPRTEARKEKKAKRGFVRPGKKMKNLVTASSNEDIRNYNAYEDREIEENAFSEDDLVPDYKPQRKFRR